MVSTLHDLDRMIEFIDDRFIPRLMRSEEPLVLYRNYYFPDVNEKFKCIETMEIDGVEYYHLENEHLCYMLSYPVQDNHYIFTLDKYHINRRNIINDHQFYKGYQIRWWIYKQQDKHMYKNFTRLSQFISDDELYRAVGKLQGSVYVDCKFIRRK